MKPLVVFAYDFKHKRSFDFLVRLFLEGFRPEIVLGQPWREVVRPPELVRSKARHIGLVDAREVCRRFGWKYEVADHNGKRAAELLEPLGSGFGLIAGARILRGPVNALEGGIINFHPALLPEGRGLNALEWALVEGRPLGVTAHLIDESIDAGRLVDKQEIPEYPDDSLLDLSLRLAEIQLEMLPGVVRAVGHGDPEMFPPLGKGQMHRPMLPEEQERVLPALMLRRSGADRSHAG